MLVSQYSSPSSSAVLGSGEMFTSIAPTYDIVNRIISLNSRDMSWRSALVSSYEIVKGVPDGGVALDLACGTGDTTFMIAEKFPNMKAIGLDPSRGMLDIAGAKQRERGQRDGNIKRISFIKIAAGILLVGPEPPMPSKIFFISLLILYLYFISCTD